MTVLVDTSVLIDHLRGDVDAREALRSAADSGQRIAASVVTKVEVLAGMRPPEEPQTRPQVARRATTLEADLWTTNLKQSPMFPELTTPY